MLYWNKKREFNEDTAKDTEMLERFHWSHAGELGYITLWE